MLKVMNSNFHRCNRILININYIKISVFNANETLKFRFHIIFERDKPTLEKPPNKKYHSEYIESFIN